MSGVLDPWREYAEASVEHDPAHGRRALAELIPAPRRPECGEQHTRENGQQLHCERPPGHPGNHAGWVPAPLWFTWQPTT